MAVTILHELAHACVALCLGVRSTLYSYHADLDLTAAQAATSLPIFIGVAGPVFCLVLGMLSWFAFRQAGNPRARLPLLFVSVFGVGTFCGNLMSAAFVGDFSAAAVALKLPMTLRYVIAAVGAVSVAAVHFWAGRELIQGATVPVGRVVGAFGLIACPVVLGTAAVILVNQPMPAAFVSARAAEGSLWLFAAIGALVTGRRSPGKPGSFELGWADGAAALLVVTIVRLMVRGIPFPP